MNNTRYYVFDNNIVSDVFGEEAVLVNLESGIYYSLRGSANQIWIRIFNQYSPAEILEDFKKIYKADESELASHIHSFVENLLEMNIIRSVDDATKKTIDVSSTDGLIEFSEPQLETFSDMQEILLLDPVHDVDKAGWPVSKNEETRSDSKDGGSK